MKCILDGELVELNNASIPVTDLTLRRGYGLFDFFRVHNDVPLYIDDHLDRVKFGADRLRLSVPGGIDSLRDQISMLIRSNQLPGISGIRILITGGSPSDGFTPENGHIIITQENFNPPAGDLYDGGTRLMTYEHRRELSEVKSVNYLTAVFLAPEMKRRGTTEVLFHSGGTVSECTRSNIFCIKDGILFTPLTGVLAGVTRKKVLHLAGEIMEVRESDFSPDFLLKADEVFITSTIKRILPVCAIDDTEFGKPGPETMRLMELLSANDRNFLSRFEF